MNATPPTPGAPGGGLSSRRRRLLGLAAVVVVAGVASVAYWFVHGRWYVGTADAYVGGTIVQVTAEVAGTVRVIHPSETESVRAGQSLLELDTADGRVALEAALAELAGAVREVRGSFVQVNRARAQLAAREVELRRAEEDMRRRDSISEGGAVSAEEVAHARESTATLRAALRAAREELNLALAQTQGTTLERHPQVARAAARVREASLALSRATIPSPVDGVVARKGVQVGQRVAPGTPLMAVVPLADVWVDANFKEGQLRRVRLGQPVKLHADLYGDGVTYHGRVKGFSPGTGAAFALLPPQNASGNWIKIVQRVPVRISLDAAEVREHPLRVGLSMDVEVDLHDQSGAMLALPPREPADSMPQSPGRDPQIEATIAEVIARNSGRAGAR